MAQLGDDDGFSLLDDEGRLLGLVNIVDLLVVLLVLAVVVAGAALLLSGSGEQDTRHATIDLGEQPDFLAEEISPGDEFEPAGTTDSITVTDVYRFEGEEGTNVIVRATVNGTAIEPEEPDEDPVFEFRGEQLRIGQTLPIQTPDYEVEGEVTQVQRSDEMLPLDESQFTMETTVSASTADEVTAGDEYTVAGETIAEITAVQQFPTGIDGERALLLGLSAQTLDRGGPTFAGAPLRVGNTIPFQGDGYEISGEIVRRGTNEIETTERQFLLETDVSASVADDIQSGDEYRLGGETLVRVESVTLYTTGQPDERRAILGVSAVTREDDGTVLFGDRQLRTGSQLPIETGEYDISGEVIRRGTLEEVGEPTTLTATVALENVRPERADAIEVGLIEELRDQRTATVLSKETEPAEVILESEDGNIFSREHPRNLDVELDIELNVRQLEDGTLQFRGESLRTGETITFDFGELRITGEIRSIER